MISQFKSRRIDIPFDQYFTPSIQDCERLRRNETASTVSIGPNQIRHPNFAGELKNTQLKEALVKIFIDHWANYNMYPFIGNKTIYLSFDKSDIRIVLVRYVTKFWRNAHLKNLSSLSPLASGWIVNDDTYDFVWFAREQFPLSVAGIVIKKPTLLENQNTTQDDDYDDIDNNGSSDDDDFEDASVFCDTFTK
ncbi:uncharacterized protein TNCV_1565821 [Trichonephila clavipes]|nr:uncharacterized protein TNCV_1565821 [Trichonephila clavipes]